MVEMHFIGMMPQSKYSIKKISLSNFKNLNKLADSESCSVNAVVSKLIKTYRKTKA
jgi:hypothetical protein